MKSLKVTEITHKELRLIKDSYQLKNMDSVICRLIENWRLK